MSLITAIIWILIALIIVVILLKVAKLFLKITLIILLVIAGLYFFNGGLFLNNLISMQVDDACTVHSECAYKATACPDGVCADEKERCVNTRYKAFCKIPYADKSSACSSETKVCGCVNNKCVEIDANTNKNITTEVCDAKKGAEKEACEKLL